MKRLIHENKDAGIKQYFHSNSDGDVSIETVQDLTDIIEANKQSANEIGANAKWGEMTRVASVPLSIFYSPDFQRLRKEQKAGNDKPLRAWLNNPENKYFRTRGGIV